MKDREDVSHLDEKNTFIVETTSSMRSDEESFGNLVHMMKFQYKDNKELIEKLNKLTVMFIKGFPLLRRKL